MKESSTQRFPKDYVDWKAAKVRTRLQEYRFNNSVKTRPLPISQLLDKMLACPALLPEMFIDGDALEIDDEWLRRFTVGQSGQEFLRVEALKLFLVHENYLSADELDDDQGDLGEQHGIFGYLGRGDSAAKERAKTLSTSYLFESERGLGSASIILKLERHRNEGLFYVEEIYADKTGENAFDSISNGPIFPPQKQNQKYHPKGKVRRGFAFFSTKANALHIFLRGSTPGDRIHLIETWEAGAHSFLQLYRFGGIIESPALGTMPAHPPSIGPRKFLALTESAKIATADQEKSETAKVLSKKAKAELRKLH